MVMECNREEAAKAVALAESKYRRGDVKGAHRMAVRAQAMYPALQVMGMDMKHLVAALQVHVAASTSDWYGVLQVSPWADAALIKKQYHKLALLLHPDKNNALPASEAFKLLSHAFRILSDSSLRAAHDLTQQQQQQNTYGRKQKDSTVEIPKQGTDGKKRDSQSAEIPKNEGNPDSQNGSKSNGQAAAAGATRAKWAPRWLRCFWSYCPMCKTPQQRAKWMINLFVLCIHCLQQFPAFKFGAMYAASNAAKNQQIHPSDSSKKQDKAASKEESIDKKNQDPPAMSASTDAPRSHGQDEARAETEGEKKQQQRQEANKKRRPKRGVDQCTFDRSAFDRLFGRDNVMKKARYSTK